MTPLQALEILGNFLNSRTSFQGLHEARSAADAFAALGALVRAESERLDPHVKSQVTVCK